MPVLEPSQGTHKHANGIHVRVTTLKRAHNAGRTDGTTDAKNVILSSF